MTPSNTLPNQKPASFFERVFGTKSRKHAEAAAPDAIGLTEGEEGARKIAPSSESVLITDAKRCPMPVFIACITAPAYVETEEGAEAVPVSPSQRFEGLIVSGSPTEEAVSAAWEAILAQYIDGTADESRKMEIERAGSDKATQLRIAGIKSLLASAALLLKDTPEELADALEMMFGETGVPAPRLDLSKPEEEIKAQLGLMATMTEARLVQMQAKQKLKKEEGESQDPITEDFFYNAVVSIATALGVTLSLPSLMVSEFCAYFRAMCKEIDARNRHAQKLKNAHGNTH